MDELNENINTNLDSLLTGINPQGLRETSKSLGEIMDTMNKSIQSMNLEKVLSELKMLQSGTITYAAPIQQVGQAQPEQISAGLGLKPPGLTAPSGSTTNQTEATEWVDPTEEAKKKKDEEEPHLLKPSDLWGGD